MAISNTAPQTIQAFLLHSNLHIMGVAVALQLATVALLGLAISWPLVFASACGAFLLYHLDRSGSTSPEDVINRPDRIAWVKAHPRFLRISVLLAALLLVAASMRLAVQTLAAGAVLGGLALLYLRMGHGSGRRLKGYWWLKPFIIAGAWAAGTVLLPAMQDQQALTADTIFLFAYRTAFLLPNIVMADWADREGDEKAGLSTIAIRYGGRRLKQIAYAWCAGAAVLAVIGSWQFGTGLLWSVELIGVAIMGGAVSRPLSDSPVYYGFTFDFVVMWPVIGWLITAL